MVVVILLSCDWPTAQVLDDDQECALGVLELPLCQILPYADLTLEQRFQLDHSGLDSLISMRLVLRVNLSLLPTPSPSPLLYPHLFPWGRRWSSGAR